MATFIGCRMRLVTSEGTYEGIAKALDLNHGRVTLDKVVSVKDGAQLKGLQHFFRHEIIRIDKVEEKEKEKKVKITPDETGPSLLKKKQMPTHLKKYEELADRFDLLAETEKKSEKEASSAPSLFTHVPYGAPPPSTNNTSPSSSTKTEETPSSDAQAASTQFNDIYLKHYSVINTINQDFKSAIRHIHSQKIIGFAIEGVDIGRKGRLCWIQICTNEHVLLFDMVKLGKQGVMEGLASVVETAKVMKVVHDCRTYSDLFFHQYGINMVNVFDTQVACVMLYRMANSGVMPRYVEGLGLTLHHHLGVPQDAISWGKHREQHQAEDQNIWAIRPLQARLVDILVQKVRYLLHLRMTLLEKMLADFTDGVDLYLSAHRDVSMEELGKHENAIHLLPSSFRDLAYEAEARREDFGNRYPRSFLAGRRDENGFQENAVALFDSKMVFSHDSIWHGGYKNFNKEEKQQAKMEGYRAAMDRERMRYEMTRQQEEERFIKPRTQQPPQDVSPRASVPRHVHTSRSIVKPQSSQGEDDFDDEDDEAFVGSGNSAKNSQGKGESPLVFIPAGTDLGARDRDIVRPTSQLPLQLHNTIGDDYDDDEPFVTIPNVHAKGTVLGRMQDSEGNSSYSSESESEPSMRSRMRGVHVTSPLSSTVTSPTGVGRGLLAAQLLQKTSPGGRSSSGVKVKASGDDAAWEEVTRKSYQGPQTTGFGRGLRVDR